jgi:hypothetical protein
MRFETMAYEWGLLWVPTMLSSGMIVYYTVSAGLISFLPSFFS